MGDGELLECSHEGCTHRATLYTLSDSVYFDDGELLPDGALRGTLWKLREDPSQTGNFNVLCPDHAGTPGK